jgi:L-lysine exporter family protein LysE/ArgO
MQWSVLITGFALSATFIIAIGAQNAFVLRQGLRREHVMPVVVFCIIADVVLITAGVLGLATLLKSTKSLSMFLGIGGACFLAVYGVLALRRARRPAALHASNDEPASSLRRVLAQVAGFTFLNPHVYLDTILLLGSIGARQPPDLRPWFIGGAVLASGGWFPALGFGSRLLAPVFARPVAWRVLDGAIGVVMLLLAGQLVYQLI